MFRWLAIFVFAGIVFAGMTETLLRSSNKVLHPDRAWMEEVSELDAVLGRYVRLKRGLPVAHLVQGACGNELPRLLCGDIEYTGIRQWGQMRRSYEFHYHATEASVDCKSLLMLLREMTQLESDELANMAFEDPSKVSDAVRLLKPGKPHAQWSLDANKYAERVFPKSGDMHEKVLRTLRQVSDAAIQCDGHPFRIQLFVNQG